MNYQQCNVCREVFVLYIVKLVRGCFFGSKEERSVGWGDRLYIYLDENYSVVIFVEGGEVDMNILDLGICIILDMNFCFLIQVGRSSRVSKVRRVCSEVGLGFFFIVIFFCGSVYFGMSMKDCGCSRGFWVIKEGKGIGGLFGMKFQLVYFEGFLVIDWVFENQQ